VGDVLQFAYGSDGLDPCAMEAKYTKTKNKQATTKEGWRPFDFNRLLFQVSVSNFRSLTVIKIDNSRESN